MNINNISTGTEYISEVNYGNSAWCYIINKKYISKINLKFVPNIFCEDSLFTMELFLNAKRMAHIDIATYYYRYNPVSIMHKKDLSHQLKMITDYHFIAKQIERIITKYKPTMNEHCLKRCRCRKNQYLFFSLIRAIKAKQSLKWNKQLIFNLSSDGLYPFKQLDKDEFKGIRWKILHIILNNKFCYLLSCQLYKLIK